MTASVAVISPLANITPARAQLFPQQPNRDRVYNSPRQPNNNQYRSSYNIPRGFVIPVEYEEEKILLTPEETIPVTLSVAANIKDHQRNILIPYGSEIIGEIRPNIDESGSFFVGSELVFPDGQTQSIDALGKSCQ